MQWWLQFLIFIAIKKNLSQTYEQNRLPSACQNFYKIMGDIDPLEMNDELERFVVIARKNKKDFKTANAFLTYSIYVENNCWKSIQTCVILFEFC